MTIARYLVRIIKLQALCRSADDKRGVAAVEFALVAPLFLMAGLYGVEITNQALTTMKVSQIALSLADNASRVGSTSASMVQLREIDINDVMQGARLQGAGIDLSHNGRVTISSLENVQQSYDTAPVQRIHWQRCFGVKEGVGYDSDYKTAVADGTSNNEADKGTDAPLGLGTGSAKVNAPPRAGVMYVEISYYFTPLFSELMIRPRIIRQSASFIVRDKRDYSQIFNVDTHPPTPRSTCDLHAA